MQAYQRYYIELHFSISVLAVANFFFLTWKQEENWAGGNILSHYLAIRSLFRKSTNTIPLLIAERFYTYLLYVLWSYLVMYVLLSNILM